MKIRIKAFFILFGLVLSTISTFGAEASSIESVWIRPVKNDTVTDVEHHGAKYRLFKGSYVVLQGKSNGNIIIGSDTLSTDAPTSALTISDQKKEVKISDIHAAYELKDSIKNEGDTAIIFAFSKLPGNRKFRLYINEESDCKDSIQIGKDDTRFLIGSETIRTIVLVPDTLALALYIPFDSITKSISPISTTSEGDTSGVTQNDSIRVYILIGCVLLLFVVLVVLFRCFKFRNKEKCNSKVRLNNACKKFYKQKSKADKFVKKINNKDKYRTLANKASRIISDLENSLSNYDEYSTVIDSYIDCIDNLTQCFIDLRNNKKIDAVLDSLGDTIKSVNKKLEETNKQSVVSICEPNIVSDRLSTPNDNSEPVDQQQPVEKDVEISELERQLKQEKDNNEKIRLQLQKLNDQLAKEEKKRDEIIEQKENKIKAAAEKEIAAANKRASSAEEKSQVIRREMEDSFNKERTRFDSEKQRLSKSLSEAIISRDKYKNDLHNTQNLLEQAKHQVENLNSEMKSVHEKLSGALDSKSYCEKILKLLELANRIQESATALFASEIEDKYLVYRSLALYFAKLNSIQMSNFVTDVEMVAKSGFVMKGTPLASYDSRLSREQIEIETRNYFFTNYLKAYIKAIVVLNESLAGLNYLVEDVKVSEIRPFVQFRNQIDAVTNELGIKVSTVKLNDMVGSNIDLLATEVDAGIERHGVIVDIENCKVSLIGGAPDDERIRVKIQS